MNKRCPFCHQDVPVAVFNAHVAEHTKLREDGQMTDHVTKAPEDQFQGDLADVPRWYRHDKCGAVTGMPEEIIRSYLADPFLYSDYTFCTGCGNYPHQSEFHWVESGENLQSYNRRLRIEFLQRNNLNPRDFVWENGAPVRRKRKFGALMWLAGCLVTAVVLVGCVSVAAVTAVALFRKSAPSQPRFSPMDSPTFGSSPLIPSPTFEPSPHTSFAPPQPIEDFRQRIEQQQEDIRRRHEEMRRQHEEIMERMHRRP
jgi:hypothetical protein